MARVTRRFALVTAAISILMVPMVGLGATDVSAASSLTITPNTGLIDGQTVHLQAAGLPGNSYAGIRQCVSGHLLSGCDYDSAASAGTDFYGSFSLDFAVRTILHTEDGTFDCRVDSCVIGTNTNLTPEGAAFGPIGFDPSGPLLPPPVVHATPATGVIDRQVVAVDGTGFRANGFGAVVQCIGGSTTIDDCRTTNLGYGSITPTGTFSATLTVRTIFVTDGGTTIDCRTAVAACELHVFRNAPTDFVVAAISFDPSAPAAPPPTITVTPATGLIDGDSVHVVGADFEPNAQVITGQCATKSDGLNQYGTCSYGSLAQADGTGSFSLDMIVHTRMWAGELLDCRDADTDCRINATSYVSYDSQASATIGFTPGGALLPLPSMVATPNTGLLDGDIVSLSGANFTFPFGPIPVQSSTAFGSSRWYQPTDQPAALRPAADPSYTVPVYQCTDASDSYDSCGYGYSNPSMVQVDAAGNLTGSAQVWAVFTTFSGQTVDCRAAGTHCQLRAGFGDNPLATAVAPVSFDPNGALLPPPTLTVTPSAGLANGTQLHVTGDGYPANTIVGFRQCQADTTGLNTCDESFFGAATTDANGHLDGYTTAKQVLQYGVTWQPNGDITFTSSYDCGTAPNGCRLTAAYNRPETAWPSVAISYATGGPTDVTPTPAPGVEATPQFTG